jgi:site-specific DNA-methyltransferase (adenine-specific)
VTLTVRDTPIAELKPFPNNPRRGDLEALRESLRENSQYKPIVVSSDGVILAGNHTYQAARAEGWTTLSAVHLEIDSKSYEARRIVAADNRIAERGNQDQGELAALLQSLDGNLEGTGYAERDLERLLRSLDRQPRPAVDPDEVPEPPANPRAKPGELWLLGEHRILCGDARDPESYKRLFHPTMAARAACVFTDPPYGMDYRGGRIGSKAVRGDNLERDALLALLADSFRAAGAVARPEAGWYIWHTGSTRQDFVRAMMAAGLEEVEYLVWAKPSAGMGQGDYRRGFEPCFYAARSGYKPAFHGDRTSSTMWRLEQATAEGISTSLGHGILVSDGAGHQLWIQPRPPKGKKIRHSVLEPGERLLLDTGTGETTRWEVAREQDVQHPTQKPVELGRRAIENSTRPGQVVLDPFLGSGSTLVSAELTGRVCYGTETDPAYIDVVVDRWQRITGDKARVEK